MNVEAFLMEIMDTLLHLTSKSLRKSLYSDFCSSVFLQVPLISKWVQNFRLFSKILYEFKDCYTTFALTRRPPWFCKWRMNVRWNCLENSPENFPPLEPYRAIWRIWPSEVLWHSKIENRFWAEFSHEYVTLKPFSSLHSTWWGKTNMLYSVKKK